MQSFARSRKSKEGAAIPLFGRGAAGYGSHNLQAEAPFRVALFRFTVVARGGTRIVVRRAFGRDCDAVFLRQIQRNRLFRNGEQ